jgi:cation transport regulator ChaB
MKELAIDQKDFDSYLELGEKGEFFYLSQLDREAIELSDLNTAEIELMPEGEWDHPTAIGGRFIVTRPRIEDWISNFKKKIFGEKLPLDFGHMADSSKTPGFIINLYRIGLDTWEKYQKKFKSQKIKDQIFQKIKSGKSLLFATLQITEPDVWQKILNGSLQWISAAVGERWQEPTSKKIYDVIKGAALTNYPYIKNMTPICVNFEEHIQHMTPDLNSNEDRHKKSTEEHVNDLEILTDELGLENVEEVQSEDGLAFFADFKEGKGYGFKPTGAKEPYGFVPKISIPDEVKKLPESQQKAFLTAFNKAYRASKDVEKAKAAALKHVKAAYGMKAEDIVNDPKTFTQKFEEFLGVIKGLGFKLIKDTKDSDKDTATLEEINTLKSQVAELSIFRANALTKENATLLEKYTRITPAAKKILMVMLEMRIEDIKLEDNKKTSVRGLLLELLAEMEKSPKVNLFETISEPHDEKLEDLDAKAKAYLKDHPDKTYTEALLEVSPKKTA